MRWLLLAMAFHYSPLHEAPAPVAHRPRTAQIAPQSDNECLANAIHYEAGSEPLEGQRAVYEVILHRAKTQRTSVCNVVKAPKQFSWVGLKPFMPLSKPLQDMLRRVKNHPKVLTSMKFKWFYSGLTPPKWAMNMDCRGIGGHNFCREREQEE